ncbi:unnamed protein product [Effrenium voratum]|nr:unnamed protein product [Effrenium voratum]
MSARREFARRHRCRLHQPLVLQVRCPPHERARRAEQATAFHAGSYGDLEQFSDAPNEASGASAPAAPRVVAPQAQAPAAVPPRLGFATPSQPRPQHVPAMHHSAWSQQQNWPGWGGGDGWGYEGYEGYGGDGWGGWDDPALWNACAAWHGKGGCGGYPAGSMGGQILVGTVKSYSSVKGFGFLIHSDIAQDIWFAKETVAAEYRTSDLAGTSMSFELIRAQDGKPQARNLRPAPSGMPPPPVNPNQHVPAGQPKACATKASAGPGGWAEESACAARAAPKCLEWRRRGSRSGGPGPPTPGPRWIRGSRWVVRQLVSQGWLQSDRHRLEG